MPWFEWLFKFRVLQFAEGEVGFQAGPMLWVFGLLAVLLLAGLLAVYAVTDIYRGRRDRALSLGLRAAVLVLLCLPLFEPVLIMPGVIEDENFVAVLVDNSQSMQIPDGTFGTTRADDVRHLLTDPATSFVPALGEQFKIRYYTFNEQPARVDSIGAGAPGAGATATNMAAALDRVMSDFTGAPLAGIVMLTDGGDNSTEVPRNQAEALRGLDIPLHLVGVGQERFAQEREILDVTVSKGVEASTGAEIDVKVRSWITETEPVAFNLYQGTELVFTDLHSLKGDGKIDQFSLFYEPEGEVAGEYRLEIAPAPQELNTENNTLDMLIDLRRDTLRVLYFEGQLRQEFKFAKRSLEDDQVVHISSIARPGTGKFYRQGILSPSELAGGFPADDAEMYRYRAIIIGDYEASAFTPAQISQFERFVSIRGGGLLMMGGSNTFAEGQYWDTPIADILPVTLDPNRRTVIPPSFADDGKEVADQGFRFQPTLAGYDNPILKLSPDGAVNRSRWATMPGLTSINYLGVVKPGALVLAEKPADEFGDREPLLVIQRYGKGRTAALATASTWRWQMHLPADDARHERFWRQLVRWLAASAPDQVHVDLGQKRFIPGAEMPLAVNLYDDRYLPMEGAQVTGRITTPYGATRQVTFQPELTEPGVYTASYVPPDEGVYRLDVVAEQGGRFLEADAESFLVRPSRREFYDATLKRSYLESLAAANNGHYYAATETAAIPSNLSDRRTSTSIFNIDYLWDMPLIFGLILLLLSIEWIYRRRHGLA